MAYNAELQRLRELGWWVLPRLRCHFCNKPMLTDLRDLTRYGKVTFGHRRHNTLHSKLTFHHPNEDRDNPKAKVVICHPSCHRKHHSEQQRAATR